MNEALPAEEIAANLSEIRRRIERAAADVGRPAGRVTLVAVSKTFGAEAVEAALAAGQTVFGENRVQEAQGKFPAVRERNPALELHLIGPLQSNKTAEAVALFDVIQTLDREKLARALAREMEKQGRRPRCFVQVNTGEEPQKAGIAPDGTAAFVRLCRDELGLPVEGLMCIPPVEDAPAPHFGLLRQLAADCGLEGLSMGMSGDFETAVQVGATHVRVGSAIFGRRAYP